MPDTYSYLIVALHTIQIEPKSNIGYIREYNYIKNSYNSDVRE